MARQTNKTCPYVEQYLSFLVIIKGLSDNTVFEYRSDLLMFFRFVLYKCNTPMLNGNFAVVDLDFIKTISRNDMYVFTSHCQTSQKASSVRRVRKIVSIL